MEPFDNTKYKYTTDKQLYNFMRINWIATACLQLRSFTAVEIQWTIFFRCIEAIWLLVIITHQARRGGKSAHSTEQAMQIQKKRHPEKIFTFDYDQFVNAPEFNLRKLLGWLDLEFNEICLHPEESTRRVNTASVMQARKPISNKSVGGWKNYETLLKPALKIIQESDQPRLLS